MPGAEIYDMFHKGPGTSAGLDTASGKWREVAKAQHDASGDVEAAMKKAGVAWQGQASESAQAGMSPLATSASQAGDTANKVSGVLTQQSGGFNTAKHTVQPVPKNPPERDFVDYINPFTTDVDKQAAAYREKTLANQHALQSYGSTTSSNISAVPTFTADTHHANVDVTDPGRGDGVGDTRQPPGRGGGGQVWRPAGSSPDPSGGGQVWRPSYSIPDSSGGGQTWQPAGSSPPPAQVDPSRVDPLPGNPGTPGWNGPGSGGGSGTGTPGGGGGNYHPGGGYYPGGYGGNNTGQGGGIMRPAVPPRSGGLGSSGGPGGGGGRGSAGSLSGAAGRGVGGFGPGGSGAGGAGSSSGAGGSGGGLGAGNATGRGPGGSAGAGGFGPAGATGGAGGRPGGAGMGGMGMAGAGRGQGGEDQEHQRPGYLVETDDIFSSGEMVAPPVIGGEPPRQQ
ncbi:WXG100 family type VII secretion target [Longimycelium tulufanense]|uniref:WXG100 family type VII secretion target n=1 Tax=Longimycelium tulufanense TaxID=907463 RepID=UPI00166F497E|nr:hypothetical protein [Longimycelium tulufanense]